MDIDNRVIGGAVVLVLVFSAVGYSIGATGVKVETKTEVGTTTLTSTLPVVTSTSYLPPVTTVVTSNTSYAVTSFATTTSVSTSYSTSTFTLTATSVSTSTLSTSTSTTTVTSTATSTVLSSNVLTLNVSPLIEVVPRGSFVILNISLTNYGSSGQVVITPGVTLAPSGGSDSSLKFVPVKVNQNLPQGTSVAQIYIIVASNAATGYYEVSFSAVTNYQSPAYASMLVQVT